MVAAQPLAAKPGASPPDSLSHIIPQTCQFINSVIPGFAPAFEPSSVGFHTIGTVHRALSWNRARPYLLQGITGYTERTWREHDSGRPVISFGPPNVTMSQ